MYHLPKVAIQTQLGNLHIKNCDTPYPATQLPSPPSGMPPFKWFHERVNTLESNIYLSKTCALKIHH